MPKTLILKAQVMMRIQVVEDDGYATTREVLVDVTEADLSSSAIEVAIERAIFLADQPFTHEKALAFPRRLMA